MIKLIDIFNTLFENKQVGVLYHFTPNIIKILKSNTLNGPVSLTRSLDTKDWLSYFVDEGNGYVIIKIDGNKLSNNYKIIPHQDYGDDHDPEDGMKYINDEMEEVVHKSIKDLKKYILSIMVPKDFEDKEILDFIKHLNINLEYVSR